MFGQSRTGRAPGEHPGEHRSRCQHCAAAATLSSQPNATPVAHGVAVPSQSQSSSTSAGPDTTTHSTPWPHRLDYCAALTAIAIAAVAAVADTACAP
jgi:hypothetical protein